MLSTELKNHTKSSHQQLEKKLMLRLRGVKNNADYATLLHLFYGYFAGLDQLINLNLNIDVLPDYSKRRKADLIAADLTILGDVRFTPVQESALPQIQNHAQALGALYVTEGSTLGGQIISQILTRQLGPIEALSFFSGYGADTMSMWEIFKDALDRPENQPGYQIIAAANDTFLKFGEWFDAND
jgi:heme oxygenase (biliverdin-IX-beta and delta-forming)